MFQFQKRLYFVQIPTACGQNNNDIINKHLQRAIYLETISNPSRKTKQKKTKIGEQTKRNFWKKHTLRRKK